MNGPGNAGFSPIDSSSLGGIDFQNSLPVPAGSPKIEPSAKSDKPDPTKAVNTSLDIQAQKGGSLAQVGPSNIPADLSSGLNVSANHGAPVGQKLPDNVSGNQESSIVGDLESIENEQGQPEVKLQLSKEELENSISKLVGDKMDLSKPKHNFLASIFRAIYNFFAGGETTTLGQDDFIARTEQFIQRRPQLLYFLNKANLSDNELKTLLKDAILAYKEHGKTSVTDVNASERYAEAMLGVIKKSRAEDKIANYKEMFALADDLIPTVQTFFNTYSQDLTLDENYKPIEGSKFFGLMNRDKIDGNSDAKELAQKLIKDMENMVQQLLTKMASFDHIDDVLQDILADYFGDNSTNEQYFIKDMIGDLMSDFDIKDHLKRQFKDIKHSDSNIARIILSIRPKFGTGESKIMVAIQLARLTLNKVAREMRQQAVKP